MFRFLLAFYFISIWPHITWTHVFWAAFIAMISWPLKKLWETFAEKFWGGFKAGVLAQLKKTPEGQQTLSSFFKARADKDQEMVKEHPELKKVLICKTCNGVGSIVDEQCDDCGGTGWA
jgi:hypothetical protein